ncbi:hypothetical protein PA598K_02668 [Paenibacillus sp. 598K]|uniref:hypothetical protein n=1 Tax=Paenibacillus sp. 598K TaxID=1117987 RepID=UPI000FFABFC9|nr:hypothetical protein [Paenibacillus sp. 598K]GBF74330.1 hypothetical protein PA598K_02668 [Paenibacillus sp. 598K]
MSISTANQINAIVLSASNDASLINRVNRLLSNLGMSEQLSLHHDLSDAALDFIYQNIDDITLDDGPLEHIVWSFFWRKVKQKSLSEELFSRLVDAYERTKYVALESLVIGLIKEDLLTEAQLNEVLARIPTKTVLKESFASRCRRNLQHGQSLSQEDMITLLDNRSYSTVRFAITTRSISREALLILEQPYTGEKDKKIRLELTRLVNEMRDGVN